MLTIDLPTATARKINDLARPWRSAYTRSAVILSLSLAVAAAMGGGPIMTGALPFVAVWAWLARRPHAAYIRAIRARKFDDAKREAGLIGRSDYLTPTLAAVVFGLVFLWGGYSTLSGCLAGPDPTVCPTATGAGDASAVMIWLIVAIVSLFISPTVWHRAVANDDKHTTIDGTFVHDRTAGDDEDELPLTTNTNTNHAVRQAVHQAIHLAGAAIPEKAESQGVFIVGSTGTGKTQSFLHIMQTARARRQKALVYDSSFEYVQHFYRPGIDHIINPFDARDVRWDPVPDMFDRAEIEGFASSFFPSGGAGGGSEDKNQFFTDAARGILIAAIEFVVENAEKPSLMAALDYISSTPPDEFYDLMFEVGLGNLAGGAETFANTMATASSKLMALSYLFPSERPFSIREWVYDDTDSWVFLPVSKPTRPVLRQIYNCVIDSFANYSMVFDREGTARCSWFFLDELSSLAKISSLQEITTEGRKYGIRPVLGMQSIAQGQAIYGRQVFQAICGQPKNRLYLQLNDAETAAWASREIGKRRVRRVTTSTSSSKGQSNSHGNGHRSSSTNTSSSTQEQFGEEDAVMASTIMGLPDMVGYVRIAGGQGVVEKRSVPLIQLPKIAEGEIRVKARPRVKAVRAKSA